MPFTSVRNSYDEFPYPSYPLPQTHPDHLATIATFLGMTPAATSGCYQVLELGCASGGNLIPLALAMPESRFVGVDLSAEQIGQGLKTIDALGLTNIELRCLSILDVNESFGQFDDILCHGVYSWVPRPVQDKIMAICADNLTPNGIGYISFNTLPGWHMRGMIRDMMFYHVHRFEGETPEQNVGRARALLDFLTRSVPAQQSPYGLMLKQHLELLQKHSDSYLFHEFLEEHNDPIYFLEFCDRLTRHGLRYLGESEFGMMVASTSFPAEVQQTLSELAPNLIEQEQYMDFLRNRMFRQTLICHSHQRPNYDVRAETVTKFHIASPLRPTSAAPDLETESADDFAASDGPTLTTTAPIVKAALMLLSEAWPQSIPFQTLLTEARSRLNPLSPAAQTMQQDSDDLCRSLLTAYASPHGLVEFSLKPSAFVTTLSEYPVASPLARYQAQSTSLVTNLKHQTFNVSEFDRQLLPFLDGTNDRSEMVQSLLSRFQEGLLNISRNEEAITDDQRVSEILTELLGQQLPKLAKAALLIG